MFVNGYTIKPCANLRNAILKGADLRSTDLEATDLRNATLEWANLRWASLRWAILKGANLKNTRLEGAIFENAFLEGADLRWATFDIASMLSCGWGIVSDELCVKLMRFDAENHPNPELFDLWAKGGPCPYRVTDITRVVNFKEQRRLWTPGASGLTMLSAVKSLFNEKNVKHSL